MSEGPEDRRSLSTGSVYCFIDEESGLIVFYGNGEMEGDFSETSFSWSSKGSYIKHIILERGISGELRKHSFYNYPNIKNVRIRKTVTSIVRSAFSGCPSLKTVTIKSCSLTFIYRTFSDCCKLETIYYYGLSEPSFDSNNAPLSYGCDKLTTV